VLVALVVIGLVWAWTGQTADNGPAVGIVDRPTPDVALPTLDGEEMRLSDYHGSVVLVNFWGTWCEPCRRETPALQAAYEQLRDEGLVVVGVNITEDELIQGKTEEDIRAFAETYGVSYPIALDMEGEMMRAFRVYPLPTSFFIDTEGTVRFMRVGEINTEEIHDLFARLQPAARSQ
jgi:peroxiredoxin